MRRNIDPENMGARVSRSEFGQLILNAIPSREAEEMVVSYLSRRVKNVPADKLAQKIKATPFVLSKNIAVKKGETIAQNLRDLGAKAEFVPHDPVARGPGRISDSDVALEVESPGLISEHHPQQQLARHGSSRPGKSLITAVVVIILIAVFSILGWQLYHLVTEKLFN